MISKHTIVRIFFILIVLGIAIQISVRMAELYSKNLPVYRAVSLWDKRIMSINIVFNYKFEKDFLLLIEKIPSDYSINTLFDNPINYTVLLKYWFHPRKFNKNPDVICGFRYKKKDFPQGYIKVYSDFNNNVILLHDKIYQKMQYNAILKKQWQFLLK